MLRHFEKSYKSKYRAVPWRPTDPDSRSLNSPFRVPFISPAPRAVWEALALGAAAETPRHHCCRSWCCHAQGQASGCRRRDQDEAKKELQFAEALSHEGVWLSLYTSSSPGGCYVRDERTGRQAAAATSVFFFGEGGYVHTFPCNSVFPHHVQSLDGGQEPLEGPPLLGLQLCRQLW